MNSGPDYAQYARKMRCHIDGGTDLEVDARFVDMLAPRCSKILDLGCGHGAAVSALRRSGHEAFGVDPTHEVLQVALDCFEGDWFRLLGAEKLAAGTLRAVGLPDQYEIVMMAGNVPAFLSGDSLGALFGQLERLLSPAGLLIIGTTANIKGGPADQDRAAKGTGMALVHRFGDWHLGAFGEGSTWSVSVFAASGTGHPPEGPDGMFVLRPSAEVP